MQATLDWTKSGAIAMELVDGQTLDALIRSSDVLVNDVPALPLDRVLPIMRQIAAALETAHDRGSSIAT